MSFLNSKLNPGTLLLKTFPCFLIALGTIQSPTLVDLTLQTTPPSSPPGAWALLPQPQGPLLLSLTTFYLRLGPCSSVWTNTLQVVWLRPLLLFGSQLRRHFIRALLPEHQSDSFSHLSISLAYHPILFCVLPSTYCLTLVRWFANLLNSVPFLKMWASEEVDPICLVHALVPGPRTGLSIELHKKYFLLTNLKSPFARCAMFRWLIHFISFQKDWTVTQQYLFSLITWEKMWDFQISNNFVTCFPFINFTLVLVFSRAQKCLKSSKRKKTGRQCCSPNS